jgi:hypothetical protein
VGLLAALLVLAFMVFWETYWRLDGYEPCLTKSDELWARTRDKACSGSPDEVVAIGSSRIWFGFDLDVWQQDFRGPRPIVLANGGTNPRPMLAELAEDPNFNGLLLVGVTPGLFFSRDNAGASRRAKNLIKYRNMNRALSGRSDFLLSVPIQSAFASFNSDLRLGNILRERWMKFPNRRDAKVPRDRISFFGAIDFDRRVKMWHKCERDPVLQRKVQKRWMAVGGGGESLAGEDLDRLITSVKGNVDKIRARGGDVVFVRFPSSGDIRPRELERHPREHYFDRMIDETATIGIHFEDYASLAGFSCPEWSHLSRVDAVTFTRNLIPIMKGLMEEKGRIHDSSI